MGGSCEKIRGENRLIAVALRALAGAGHKSVDRHLARLSERKASETLVNTRDLKIRRTRLCSGARDRNRTGTPFLRMRGILSPLCLPISPPGHWQRLIFNPNFTGFDRRGASRGYNWRRVPESNRCLRICNPLHNHFANPPFGPNTAWRK